MTTTTASPGLGEIGQITFTVADVPRATAFYRDVLGLKFLFTAAPNLAFFTDGRIRLMLAPPEPSSPSPIANSVVYFKVADIRAAHAALQARGVAFDGEPHLIAKMPDHDLWMAFLRDPERNLIGLMSEVKRG